MSESSEPLANVRVIDAAHVIAGPGIATRLSDFGADVIKVEHPESGDTTRSLGWVAEEETLWWKHLGRNKKALTLDLSAPEGQEVFTRLAASADVVVESFRPGTMERWTLGPGDLCSVNERLIYVRVSGFGQTGPDAGKPGFGTLAEALSGFAHISGFPDQPPVLPPIALADEVAALVGAFAVMVALFDRECRSGLGQVIDVALTESLLQLLGPMPMAYDVLGANPQRTGNRLPYAAPRGAYQTSDGKWLALSGTSQSVALRVLRLLGGGELADDPRFATNEARVRNVEELDRLIDNWVGCRTSHQALAEFAEADVAAAPVYDMQDLFADAQYAARRSLVEVDDPDLGTVRTVSPQPQMSRTPPFIKYLGRRLGADTDEVLTDLGYDPLEIRALHDRGIT
ncbi:MAG: CaiB/BaiF CoA transferase family protein [Acidimicrobiia bacterium]